MVGERIQKLLDRLDSEDDVQDLRDSPLLRDHREKIREKMDSAGGCCSAAEVAEAVRSQEQEYR